jgi:hypothetical protein
VATKGITKLKKAIATEPTPPLVLPLEPWIIIDGRNITATETGCEAIRLLAGAHKFQETIAAIFHITSRQFKTLLGDGLIATPARLAWESGKAFAKQRLVDIMIERAEKGDMNSGMYITRAVYGLHDKSNAAVTVENKIGFQFLPPDMSSDEMQRNMVAAAAEGILLLPQPMSDEAYMKSIGQTEVFDSRPLDKRDPIARLLAGTVDGPLEHDAPPMKDVSAPPVTLGSQSPEDADRQKAFAAMADETTRARIAAVTAGATPNACDAPRPLQRATVTTPYPKNHKTGGLIR